MTDAVTVLRKLITEHAERLRREHNGEGRTEPFMAVIDDSDAETLADAILADQRFAALREAQR